MQAQRAASARPHGERRAAGVSHWVSPCRTSSGAGRARTERPSPPPPPPAARRRSDARQPRARSAPPCSAPEAQRPSSGRARAGAAEGGGAAGARNGRAQHARHARGAEADRDAHQPRAGALRAPPRPGPSVALRGSARSLRGRALSRIVVMCRAAAPQWLGIERGASKAGWGSSGIDRIGRLLSASLPALPPARAWRRRGGAARRWGARRRPGAPAGRAIERPGGARRWRWSRTRCAGAWSRSSAT